MYICQSMLSPLHDILCAIIKCKLISLDSPVPHEDNSQFFNLFIYFIKTPEFEEMGTTYTYNDTDNIITRIHA